MEIALLTAVFAIFAITIDDSAETMFQQYLTSYIRQCTIPDISIWLRIMYLKKSVFYYGNINNSHEKYDKYNIYYSGEWTTFLIISLWPSQQHYSLVQYFAHWFCDPLIAGLFADGDVKGYVLFGEKSH